MVWTDENNYLNSLIREQHIFSSHDRNDNFIDLAGLALQGIWINGPLENTKNSDPMYCHTELEKVYKNGTV